jgi:catechol 2,3-dioxygenase-like lactoylglutathione lyase family enzyme
MKFTFSAIILTLALGACASVETMPSQAASSTTASIETPSNTNPLDLRRTTLVVKDIDKSLALYRDALGMTVAYDQQLTSPGLTERHGNDGQNRSRLVLLKANNDFIGMLGLWQFLDQTEKDMAAPDPADFTPGEIVLLFNSRNLDQTFPAAAAVPGVTALGEPHERRYPSPAGDIVVNVSMLVDPDGHTIELNQIISDPRQK